MSLYPELYSEAQKTLGTEVKQVYLDTLKKCPSIKRLVYTQDGLEVRDYVDRLNAEGLITEDPGALAERSIAKLYSPKNLPLLIITPYLISAQFPIEIFCPPSLFNNPEAEFQSLVIDNYVFMGSHVFAGFDLPDGRRVNRVSAKKLREEKRQEEVETDIIIEYLDFLGKKNQFKNLPRRGVEELFQTKVDIAAKESLLKVMETYPRQAHDLWISLYRR